MTLKSILVQTNIDDDNEGRVKVAAGLADRFGASLIGVSACAIQLITSSGMAAGVDLFVEDPEDIQKQLQALEKAFRDAAGGKGKGIEWRGAIGFPTEHATRQARAADLVVTGQSESGSAYRTVNPADLIMLAGRPVLVVPKAVTDMAAERVVVAWKDTREARRAVLDSLPFLEKAAEVTVVAVAEKDDRDAGLSVADAAAFLRRHDVKAKDVRIDAKGSAGEQIIALAAERRADLIVAGAYGHNRLREWIFGGVTRDLLTRSPVCVLLSN